MIWNPDSDDLEQQASALSIRNTSSAVARVLGSAAGTSTRSNPDLQTNGVSQASFLLRVVIKDWNRALDWTRQRWSKRGEAESLEDMAMRRILCKLLAIHYRSPYENVMQHCDRITGIQ